MKPTHATLITGRFRGSRMAAAALALSALGTRAAEAQPRPAPPCLQDGQALEAAAKRALIAFRDVPGDDFNSRTGRGQAALEAAGATELSIGQVAACYAGGFAMFAELANVTLRCDGWSGVGTPHSSGGPAAEASCQEAYGNYTKFINDLNLMSDASGRSHQEAVDALNRLFDSNPPEPLRTRTRELRDRITAYKAGFDSCMKDSKSWRPPQASLPAPKKLAPPAIPTPPVLASFDAYLGARYAIHLDNGKATVGSADATLDGGVTISLKNDPSTKVSVNGHVVLRVAAAAAGAPAGNMQAAGGLSTSGMALGLAASGGPSVRTWSSLEGRGSVGVSLWGWSASLGESQGLNAGPDGILYLGASSFDFFGCRYETDDQTRFEPSALTMHGKLTCGSYLLSESSSRVTPSGRSGSGRLQLFGHTYDMTYDLGASRLKAHGRYQAPTTGWTRVPGLDAEWRVSRPTVDVSLDGPSLTATFDTDKVEVETVSRNKSGQPWAQASIDPDPVTIGFDGNFLLRLAQLPSASDTERAARDACLAAANKIPAGNVHNAAVNTCNSDHPAPPSIPNVPTSITVNVGVVVK